MRNLLLTTTIAFTSITAVYAQPGSGYAQRAIEDKYEKDNAGNKAKGMAWMQGATNGKTEPAYKFTQDIKMHITTYKDGDVKGENDMEYFLNPSEKYFGIKAEDNSRKRSSDMFIIYDNKNQSMIMLNEKEKSGMAMNINSFMSKAAQERRDNPGGEKGDNTMKCNKTGKTKTIQGHSCFEFVCIDEDRNTRTEAWVTTDIKIDISQSFARGALASFGNSKAGGFLMEGNFYKNNQLQTKMEVTAIDTKANVSKNMSDYKMGMH